MEISLKLEKCIFLHVIKLIVVIVILDHVTQIFSFKTCHHYKVQIHMPIETLENVRK
jgi:hypothetical protein